VELDRVAKKHPGGRTSDPDQSLSTPLGHDETPRDVLVGPRCSGQVEGPPLFMGSP